MNARTARLREVTAGAAGGGLRSGAELASTGRHADQVRRAMESARASSATASKRACEAARSWLRARAAREALERALAAWAKAQRKAREAAEDADVEEAWAAGEALRARGVRLVAPRGSSGGAG